MVGVSAYRQLLRKLRTAGGAAPTEDSAAALQQVSACLMLKLSCKVSCRCRVFLFRRCASAKCVRRARAASQAKERVLLRLSARRELVQRDPRRAFARLRDEVNCPRICLALF